MKKFFNFKILIFLAMSLVIFIGCTKGNNQNQLDNNPEESVNEVDNHSVEDEISSNSEVSFESENAEVPGDSNDEDISEEIIETDETDVVLSPASYFPINLGSTWSYLGDGMEYASFTREVIFQEGNKGQMKEDNTGTVMATVYEVNDEGVKIVFSQGESYDDENFINREPNEDTFLIKVPIEVGNSWDTEVDTREIVDLDSSVETPLGTLEELLKIKVKNIDSIFYEYYKSGIGLVKREFSGEGFEVTSTLEEYNINE